MKLGYTRRMNLGMEVGRRSPSTLHDVGDLAVTDLSDTANYRKLFKNI